MSVGLEVDSYGGVDMGESWSEGTNPRRLLVGNVRGGKYIVQAQSQVDPKGDQSVKLELTIKRDVPALRYTFVRSEENTSELQSLMRIAYAYFCLKKKKR